MAWSRDFDVSMAYSLPTYARSSSSSASETLHYRTIMWITELYSVIEQQQTITKAYVSPMEGSKNYWQWIGESLEYFVQVSTELNRTWENQAWESLFLTEDDKFVTLWGGVLGDKMASL